MACFGLSSYAFRQGSAAHHAVHRARHSQASVDKGTDIGVRIIFIHREHIAQADNTAERAMLAVDSSNLREESFQRAWSTTCIGPEDEAGRAQETPVSFAHIVEPTQHSHLVLHCCCCHLGYSCKSNKAFAGRDRIL